MVRLVCTYATGNYKTMGATGEDIATDGTTGAFEADVTPPAGHVCRIRATPAGDSPPVDLSPFTGPKVAVSGLESGSLDTGPNAGAAASYYIASMIFTAGSDFFSLGECGLNASYIFDPSPSYIYVFSCNAWTPVKGPQDDATLTVDGHPSYGPAGVRDGRGKFFSAFADRQPYPLLGYSYHIDPATHDLAIHETDHFVKCAPGADTFPPTASSCTSFADAGVKLDRTIVADHGQRLVRFLDRWSSTDGHAHGFSTQYENDHCLAYSGCSSNVGFRFPGDAAYTVPPDGSLLERQLTAPGTILVKDTTAPDGDATRGQGATVYSVAPDRVYFSSPSNSYLLDYDLRSVPAKGSLEFRFGYATALTTAAVNALARPVEDSYAPPRVTIGTPINGDSTANASVLVKGRATDNVGVKSFTLNGRPLALGPGGRFSKLVKLKAGKNPLTAVATDAAGNRGRAQSTIFELLAKTRKPGAKRRQGAVVVDSGQALVCPRGFGPCTTTSTATAGPGKVGGASLKTPGGKRPELTFKLNSKGEQALDDHGHLKIRLKIDIRYGKLAHVTTTRRFDVKRP
jgi:hypothetical protein